MSALIPAMSRRVHPLAGARAQRDLLEKISLERSFDAAISESGQAPLHTIGAHVLQMNVGRRCNQTCRHCHVDAGPDRTEVMADDVLERCLTLLESLEIPTLDITGGAPELHPRFRYLVRRARALGVRVMNRCNLTVTRLPRYSDLPRFFADQQVEIVASLPHYALRMTDAQRGEGVFEDSIAALKTLNALGYGQADSGLILNLVTNPVGAFLPGQQAALEREWKAQLERRYGIRFNRLFSLTNMPISRYLEFLVDSGNLRAYLEKLVSAFNPAAVDGLMCRFTLSVGWDGRLYDCDFNQMLELALPQTVFDLQPEHLVNRKIRTASHCFGCTAGSGSSCGGATAV